MKTCIKCNQLQSLDSFGKNNRNADGKQNVCKSCVNAKRKAEYARDKERVLANNMRYRKSERGKVFLSKYRKKWRENNPDKYQSKLSKHRLSDEEKNLNKIYRKQQLNLKKEVRELKRQNRINKILEEYKDKISCHLPSERYKDIEKYEGKYMVSNHGNVLSLKRGRLLKQILSDYGYLKVTLYNEDNKYGKKYLVHRLVAIAFIPNKYEYEQVNHMDFNKQNNIVTNLEWCTNKTNAIHAMAFRNKTIGSLTL